MIPKQILEDHVIRVLLITSNDADRAFIAGLVSEFQYSKHTFESVGLYEAGLAAVSSESHDVYLVDSQLGPRTGIELIAESRRYDSAAPFILLTHIADHDMDIEALDAGAADFLVKDRLDSDRLERSIRHALVHTQTHHELIAATEQALAATEAKTRFLANVAHDIRSPLTTIIGMTEIVLRDTLNPNQRESLDTVLVASESLADLADRLVDVAKIESGEIELDPEPFNVRDTIADVVRIFGLRAQQKGIDVVIDIPMSFPERVVGDGPRLQQVLIDLVSNALKFTERGRINIEVDDLAHDEKGGLLTIKINDTGSGISADLQSSIFERSEKATTAGSHGTGLGVVHRIVTAMDGTIAVHSKLGKGSTFAFTVRVGVAEKTVLAAGDGLERKSTVLVVSSSPEDRRALEIDFESGGLDILMVNDIGAAADAAAAAARGDHPLDAIVLDTAYKPFEIATTLIDLAGGATPVTLLAPSGREGDEPRCREAGVRGYVGKPAEPGVLVDVVRATIAAAQAGGTKAVITPESLGATRPKMRLLVVDDVRTNLSLTVRMLTERGHDATGVGSGVEAIDAFEQAPYDVVLMDIQMPGLDGFDTTAAIRAEEVLQGIRRTPVVALTGHTTSEERDRCLAAGMDGFLSKPVRPDALFAAVEQFGEALLNA